VPKQFIINDETAGDDLYPATFGRGHDPSQVVPCMFAPPAEIPLVPESEWVPRIRDRKKYKTGLRDLYDAGRAGKIKDQNGQGYCWAYSLVRTCEYVRAAMGLEYTALSAHSVACKVKNFRDEGGWCGLSAQFVRANGVAPESLWPAKSMSRGHDTPAAWEEGRKYRITEDFVDLTRAAWDQDLTWQQVVSCLLQNIPVVGDYNWWGHSVCLVDVDVVDGEVCPDIDNSWTEAWGDKGTARLQGRRKYPDGAVATRVLNPA
jgi:C1A family cysteine protease